MKENKKQQPEVKLTKELLNDFVNAIDRNSNLPKIGFFDIDKEQREEINTLRNELYENTIREKWDIVGKYLIYDNPDTAIKMMSLGEYNNLWKTLREEGVDLTEKTNRPTKRIKIFDEYSLDELKKYYKSYELFCVTEYMKYYKRYISDTIDELHIEDRKFHQASDRRVVNKLTIKGIDLRLDSGKYKDEGEKLSMQYRKAALQVFNEVLFWCTDRFEIYCKNYDSLSDHEDPQDLLDELHINDEEYKRQGRKTRLEMYNFIWNSLQYASLDDLIQLNRLVDKGFITRDPGRPNKDKKIYKYDLYNKLLATYNNRKECMEHENISMSNLYKILKSGKKYQGYIFEEEK